MFGLVLPTRARLPFTILSPTQYACSFAPTPPFSHLVVFLLPNTTLPPSTAAAVYISFTGPTGTYKLLGALSMDKQSAIFKVKTPALSAPPLGVDAGPILEVDMDAADVPPEGVGGAEITLGISIETSEAVAAQVAELAKGVPTGVDGGVGAASSRSSGSVALVKRSAEVPGTVLTTRVLAQRIIGNAFNFLASYGSDVVPLKSFQDWWGKFERKLEADPGFLERNEL
jgi:hypothetical protein